MKKIDVKKENFVFVGGKCIGNASDYLVKLKGDEKKIKHKIVDCNLQLHAHNGSEIDFWIFLNYLPCDKRLVDIIEIGKSIIFLKVFNGYIQEN